MEEEVGPENKHILDSKVLEGIVAWIPHTSNTRGQQNHYLHTVNLYWHIKLLLGKMLVDKREAQDNLVLML